MPSIDTVDSLVIPAPAQALFDIVLDYPRMHEWYPRCRVQVIGSEEVAEGTRLRHELSPPGSPLKTRFTRTIRRIDPGKAIEESYDDGDLVGHGRWAFEAISPEDTRVSFRCRVRSNRVLMHVGFALMGERGHNAVYQSILASLRARAVVSRT
ncbi:SRPBCC family protein [Myxococcota bacterium]|nr:SRPBCC family protein [Myxococcota bacterium]